MVISEITLYTGYLQNCLNIVKWYQIISLLLMKEEGCQFSLT